MTIRLHIDRIVLDAGLLPGASVPAMEAALGAELSRLLAANPVFAGQAPGAALARIDLGHMTAPTGGDSFGAALAAVLNGGLA